MGEGRSAFERIMSRQVPLWALLLTLWFCLLGAVLFGWAVQNQIAGGVRLGLIGTMANAVARFPANAAKALAALVALDLPTAAEIEHDDPGGFTADPARADDGYLLLSTSEGDGASALVRLIRLADGKEVHRWRPDVDAINSRTKFRSPFAQPYRAGAFGALNPLILPDGGIVFQAQGPLVKLNRCSNVEWVLDGVFHHSNELGPDGNIWVPTVIEPSSLDPERFPGYRDDAIAKVSPDGRLLNRISIAEILIEGGYAGLLFGAGPFESDAIHLNMIRPAFTATPFWQAGDLLLSLRNRSAVLLYRPGERRILWIKLGPWVNQHDPEFYGTSQISVFGNDVARVSRELLSRENVAKSPGNPIWLGDMVSTSNFSSIYVIDLATGRVGAQFSSMMAGLQIREFTQGRAKLFADGSAFVEDSIGGRAFRFTPDHIMWRYVSRPVPSERARQLYWSRYLTAPEVQSVLPRLACPAK